MNFKLLVILSLFHCSIYSQTYLGGGISVGNKNKGPRLELLTLNSFGFQTGLEWQKFNVFSYYAGGKFCPFQKFTNEHTFWINMNFNQTFGAEVAVESDDKIYTYDLQRFKSLTPSVEYRLEFGHSETSLGYLCVNLGYRYYIENVELTENGIFPNSSMAVQSKLQKRISSPIDFHVSMVLFITAFKG
jgi:hypothetical protein